MNKRFIKTWRLRVFLSTFLVLVNLYPYQSASAVSDEYIFTKSYSGEIFKRPLDGSGSSVQLGTVGAGISLLGYGSSIYICYGSIRRIGTDGTGLVTLNSASVFGCATDGTYIYYGYEYTQSIGRMNLNGTGANDNWITFTNSGLNSGWMTVVDNYLYFGGGANASSKVLGRVLLTGGTVTSVYSDPCAITGISSDGTYLYLAHYGCSTVGRVLLDGTSGNSNFITGLSSSDSWASQVWNGKLYILNNSNVLKANLDGTGVINSYLSGVGSRGMTILGTPTTPTTLIDFFLPSSVTKGLQSTMSATFSAKGKVTFLANGKKNF